MELVRALWNIVAVLLGIVSLGVVIGAIVNGMWWFALFYSIFAVILIMFCRI